MKEKYDNKAGFLVMLASIFISSVCCFQHISQGISYHDVLLKSVKTYMDLISEFTHVMLKVCVKLAALTAEWPSRKKTYGPLYGSTIFLIFR